MTAKVNERELQDLLDAAFIGLLDGKESLQSALDLSSEQLEERYAQAYALYQSDEQQAAKEAFIQLVTVNPWCHAYWMGLGATAQLTRDFEQALRAYAVAALLDPEDPFPHYHAAQCLVETNQKSDAMKALKLAEQRVPKNETRLSSLLRKIAVLRQKAHPETRKL